MTNADVAIDATLELIVVCTADDIIRFANIEFASLFNAQPQALHGQSFSPFEADTVGIGESRHFMTEMATAAGTNLIQWELAISDHGERLYTGRLAADRRQNRPVQTLGTVSANGAFTTDNPSTDEGALERAHDDDDGAMRYLAIMSHEMRTPLNGILGMASLLMSTDLNANQRTYAEAVRESGGALLALINDILDFSKLNAGKLDLEQEPFDPYALIQGVTELLAPRAAEKGIEIGFFVAPNVPSKLAGDEARVRQVLLNLAGNGVKFTEVGGVSIEARMDACPETGSDCFVVDVRDTGIGISKEAQAQIFNEFSQVDDVIARRAEGAGLGLAISQRLAAAMPGKVCVESEPGKGSVFTFRAGLKAAGDVNVALKAKDTPVVVATRSGILARIIRLQLDAFGVTQRSFADTHRQAMDSLKAQPGALLICDTDIADSDKGALAAAADRALVLLPPDARDAIPGLRKRGFDGYLIKPIRQTTLMRELARAPRPQEKAPLSVDALTPVSAKKPLTILLAEDNQINAVLAVALIKRAGHRVDVAGNGLLALEALQQNKYDLVFMDMHMPEMDGLEAARQIRALAAPHSNTPIVALTANAMAADRQKCMAAGMDDFLPKPFDPEDLHAMVTKWGSGRKAIGAAS